MSAAPASFDPLRAQRGLDRLLGHFVLVGRMTANAERVGVQKRLERELGPELARRLVSGLSRA